MVIGYSRTTPPLERFRSHANSAVLRWNRRAEERLQFGGVDLSLRWLCSGHGVRLLSGFWRVIVAHIDGMRKV